MIDTWMIELPHGIRLSCRSAGERGRPVLMFLHGFPEAAFAWDGMLEHFSRPDNGGWRCVAPNLRGYAPSSSPTEVSAYHAHLLQGDIAALIAAECGAGGRLAALVAHDWGGAVAWGLAAAQPGLMQRLVIINSPHPQTFARELQHNPAQQAACAYMNFLIRPDAERLLADNDFARLWPFLDLMGASGAQAQQQAVARIEHDNGLRELGQSPLPEGAGWLTPALRDRYRAVWRGEPAQPDGAALTGMLNYYRATPLRPPRPGDRAAADVRLPPGAFTITVPTLVLWALQDIALLPGLLDGLDQWVPQLRLARLPHGTHWVVHEQPQRVAQLIGDFVTPPG